MHFDIRVHEDRMEVTVDQLSMVINDKQTILKAIDSNDDPVILPVDKPFWKYTIREVLENIAIICGLDPDTLLYNEKE